MKNKKLLSPKMMFFLFLISISALPVFAKGEGYPSRSIDFIIAWPPGGAVDAAIRVIQPHLQEILKQPVVLLNKSGGGGALAANFVLNNARADGYTVLVTTTTSMTLAPVMNSELKYRHSDFVPICIFATNPMGIIARSNSAWKTIEAVTDYAKKNPGKLTYGTPGIASVSFFCAEIWKMHNNLDIPPVHFSGTPPLLNAILGGHVELAAGSFTPFEPHVEAGTLRSLVVSHPKRLARFPDVPTMEEIGLPDATLSLSTGIFVSKKCPTDVINILGKAVEKVLKDPDNISKLEKTGNIAWFYDSSNGKQLLDREHAVISGVAAKVDMTK